MNLAALQITHNRIIDTKIGMEIIKHLWKSQPLLQSVDIFHAYNGPKILYPELYLEKKIIRRKNFGHYDGAANLIDEGITAIFNSFKKYDYIFVMSGDTWLVKPEVITNSIKMMESKKFLLATTLWPNTFFIPNYFATEFFIISGSFAKKIFPLNLVHFFKNRSIDNMLYKHFQKLPILTVPKVELCFTHKVLTELNIPFWNFHWRKFVYLFPSRKLFFGSNRYYSPKMGYISHHNLEQKIRLALKEEKLRDIVTLSPILQEQCKYLSIPRNSFD